MSDRPSIIYFTDGLDAAGLERFARRIEELDFDTLLVPEFFGREPFSTVAWVLAHTTRLVVATGIANVYARDAIIAAQARQTLAEFSGGRFVLGLGVSHPPMAEAHGLEWVPPVRKMRAYLDTIEQTKVQSPEPTRPAPIWLAAHGPGLLRLAGERADGANTYLMPAAHTAKARELVGDKRLNVVLPCCLTDDAETGRRAGRRALRIYLPLPAYRRQWKQWGFDDADFEDGGSDRLIDGIVAWGDAATIRARMDDHRRAGASNIAISPLPPVPSGPEPDWNLLETLAS